MLRPGNAGSNTAADHITVLEQALTQIPEQLRYGDEQQRRHIEAGIRAAMDRLLRGNLPPGGRCDVKTLAAAAAVTRNSLYTTYSRLKDEFERRRERQRDAGVTADPRQAQIARLKADNAALRERLADRDTTIAHLTALRTTRACNKDGVTPDLYLSGRECPQEENTHDNHDDGLHSRGDAGE
ncbi:hypothetical protein GCM10022225_07340 [Plantactinospora mayteni]